VLFVSRFFPYEHGIQNGASRFELVETPNGTLHQEVVVKPHLTAVFRRGALPYAAQQVAQEVFDAVFGSSNGDPPGPYRRANVASDPDFEGMMYAASVVYRFYSFVDTATDCPKDVPGLTDDQVRALYEAKLSASPDIGARDLLRIEQQRVTAPWPAYDDLVTAAGVSTATVAKRIVETAKTIGADLNLVAAYERENQNREYVLAGIVEEQNRERRERAEVEALSA
jgi:hypothetical protein